MPKVRFPKVNLKLGFLKKLLHRRRSAPEPAVSEPAADIGPYQHRDEKAATAPEEPPLEECPICHDPVGVENPEGVLETWVHLHCKHKFGTQCIQTWLEESAEREPHLAPSCPICRTTAKHPCGHPITLPASRLSPFAFLTATMPPEPPASPGFDYLHRRPRRRLSRRWGHPLRPMPARPYAPHVQTVGRCSICVATEARQNILRQMADEEIGEPLYLGRSRTSDRRTAIKSILLQSNLRRLGGSTLEASHAETYRTPVETLMDQSAAMAPDIRREYVNLCRSGVAASGTPVPASSGVACL